MKKEQNHDHKEEKETPTAQANEAADTGESSKNNSKESAAKVKKILIILLPLIITAGLIYYFRSIFVAATVNGEIIPRVNVIQDIERQFGEQALDGKISELLEEQEAKKLGVVVTQEEIDQEVKSIADQLGAQNTTLEEALSSRGMTLEILETQIRRQKRIEKILADRIVVNDIEVETYVRENKEFLPEDMEQAELIELVKQQLKQEKLASEYEAWITEVKARSNIKYLVEY